MLDGGDVMVFCVWFDEAWTAFGTDEDLFFVEICFLRSVVVV